jgi:hypothetical protein
MDIFQYLSISVQTPREHFVVSNFKKRQRRNHEFFDVAGTFTKIIANPWLWATPLEHFQCIKLIIFIVFHHGMGHTGHCFYILGSRPKLEGMG